MHYGVALLHITDQDAYDRYRRSFADTLVGTGGRVLAADTTPGVLEGDWAGDKVILLEFPDAASFGSWTMSARYREIARDRHAGSHGIVLSVRGLT
ncbi:MAG: DUF1330 domain-containing protein [Gammaproteobacteria bacterium]